MRADGTRAYARSRSQRRGALHPLRASTSAHCTARAMHAHAYCPSDNLQKHTYSANKHAHTMRALCRDAIMRLTSSLSPLLARLPPLHREGGGLG
jgi:hypothetical protein